MVTLRLHEATEGEILESRKIARSWHGDEQQFGFSGLAFLVLVLLVLVFGTL